MDADYVFGSTNTNTCFECPSCAPLLELNVLQCHVIINALTNMVFDRALLDFEQAELDNIIAILSVTLETNQ